MPNPSPDPVTSAPAAGPVRHQIIAALTIGAAGLMVTGLSPIILGQLNRDGRLSASEIGLSAMAELLTMGLTCGAAGGFLKPVGMRRIALIAALLAVTFDMTSPLFSHGLLMLARSGAGAAEGVMLWIAIALIARQPTPEKTAALFLTAQVTSAFLVAGICAAWVAPVFGANGLFVAIGTTALVAAIATAWTPDRLQAISMDQEQAEGLPPRRGWIALAAMFAYVAAGSSVYVYLDPIARLMTLGSPVVTLAVQGNLVAQIAGGLAVTALAGRLRYPVVFILAGCLATSVYLVYLSGVPAAGFVLATCLTGFTGMVMTAFFVPFALAADPGRRAAAMSGGAQILGGAGGPLIAATVGGEARRVIILSIGWIVLSVATALWLASTQRPVETTNPLD